jgi:PAS domain S-box-containing protein
MTPLAAALVVACVLACSGMAVAVVRLRQRSITGQAAFDALATRAPVGILRADAQGMCTFANEAWCQISGLSREETLGRAWSHAVHPDDLAGTMEKWEQSVREQRPYSHEVRLLRPDGTVRHVLASACPTPR